jgi:hypothetical protein
MAKVTKRTQLARWAGLGGIVYVLAVIVYVLLVKDGPDGDAAPAEVVAWFSDSGHRDRLFIGWCLFMLGLFALLWFVASLRAAVASFDDSGMLAQLVLAGGTIYIALAGVAVSLDVAVNTMSDDTYKHTVYPELIHAADDAFWVIQAAGFVGMSAMMIAAAVAALRAKLVRPWLGWLGVAVGIVSIAGIVGIPQILTGLWLIGASIALFRAGGTEPAAAKERPDLA